MMRRRPPNELSIFAIALLFYSMSAGGYLLAQSGTPYFVYLADALLTGQIALIPPLPRIYDLLFFENNYYIAGAPLPGVLMMPGVLIAGTGFSDIAFGVLVGAINIAVVYAFLGQIEMIPVSEQGRRWLTLLFAVGTPHWYLSTLGTVWFVAQIVAVLFLMLYVVTLIQARTVWAGFFLSLAFLARPSTLYTGAFVLAYALLVGADWESRLRAWLRFGLGFAPGFSVALLYNRLRFGSWLEFGYDYVQGAENITEAFARIGGFNPQFLGCNVTVSLFGLPDVFGRFSPLTARACAHLLTDGIPAASSPLIAPNPVGMSMFLVTPALILIFRANYHRALEQACAITFLAVLFTLWIYHNTGSLQFGYRYLLDATPFWLLLLASGWHNAERLRRWRRPLIILSILVQLWGFLWIYGVLNQSGWLASW